MGKLLLGTPIAERLNRKTLGEVKKLRKQNIIPRLGVILVGTHKPSELYVRKKQEAASTLGIDFTLYRYKKTIRQAALIKQIREIQEAGGLSGLIVQLPLPAHLDTHTVLNTIKHEVDVDCLTDMNMGKLLMNSHTIAPPTAQAVFSLLHSVRQPLQGKNVTILGTGPLVGKPIAVMMMNVGASVTTCDKYTKNIATKTQGADIVISGVGKKDLLTASMIREGAIVIGAGVEFDTEKVRGDVDVRGVKGKARYVTPTIGGVGPLTVAHLLHNTVLCAKKSS